MSGFHDVRFPLPLAFGATGGPQIPTEIITLANGREQRNATNYGSRRRYDAGVGVKGLQDIQTLIAFFEARRGQLYSFRFFDPMDNAGALESFGIGDGTTQIWQLVKNYADESGNWQRIITRPVTGTIEVFINGVATTAYSVDTGTGRVDFDAVPAIGAILSASFTFDVPVRFDTDHLNTSLESFGAGGAVHVPLIEVLPYA